MVSILVLLAISFAVSLALTPICRDAFLRAGLVDRPDAQRKLHGKPIPRVGGIPIAVAYVLSLIAMLVLPLAGRPVLGEHLPAMWRLMPAVLLIFLTGMVDDLYNIGPKQKLAGQLGAAILAWLGGARILGVAGFGLPEWISLPVTIIWLIGCANAFNLIDGTDGLAAGLGLFATLATLGAAFLKDTFLLALATAPLAGALLGFLRYNFPPASIFLGDSGSLLIGFLLGAFGALWSQKAVTAVGMAAPLMVLAIPILDVLLTIARRALRGRPIFSGDRGHIHHRLLDRGLTPRAVALVLYAICGIGAFSSLIASALDNHYSTAVFAAFCVVMAWGVRSLRYVEFDAVGSVLRGRLLRRIMIEQIQLGQLRESLRRAATPLDCWQAIRETARILGVDRVQMHLMNERFADDGGALGGAPCVLRVVIGEQHWMDCRFRVESMGNTHSLMSFSRLVCDELLERLPFLRPSLRVDPQLLQLAQNLSALARQPGVETTPPVVASLPAHPRQPVLPSWSRVG